MGYNEQRRKLIEEIEEIKAGQLAAIDIKVRAAEKWARYGALTYPFNLDESINGYEGAARVYESIDPRHPALSDIYRFLGNLYYCLATAQPDQAEAITQRAAKVSEKRIKLPLATPIEAGLVKRHDF